MPDNDMCGGGGNNISHNHAKLRTKFSMIRFASGKGKLGFSYPRWGISNLGFSKLSTMKYILPSLGREHFYLFKKAVEHGDTFPFSRGCLPTVQHEMNTTEGHGGAIAHVEH